MNIPYVAGYKHKIIFKSHDSLAIVATIEFITPHKLYIREMQDLRLCDKNNYVDLLINQISELYDKGIISYEETIFNTAILEA